MKTKYIIFNFLILYSFYLYSTILLPHRPGATALFYKNKQENIPSLEEFGDIDKDLFFENLIDNIEISHIFNSHACDYFSILILDKNFEQSLISSHFAHYKKDNSLYVLRLIYNNIGIKDSNISAKNILKELENASLIEKSILIVKLGLLYNKDLRIETKESIKEFVLNLWVNSKFKTDSYFLIQAYLPIRKETNGIYDNLTTKFGENFFGEDQGLPNPKYFYFIEVCSSLGIRNVNSDYTPHFSVDRRMTINEKNKSSIDSNPPWYVDAYNELIDDKQPLDADFIFYWFRNAKNEIMIDLARQHIQNQDFKDARYKTIYYLVNHDFDYSFPILTKMVQDGSLHINEKKNFYRGLANLNKLPYSVLTKEQQQKANDYLKQQMHSEQDISIKLYIDFLLSICVDEYGLSNERTSFLNSLKEIGNLSQEDIAQIDRRLKIIKYSIYTHSPSIFDSYVNGLTTEKPFIDVSKVDIHMLPVYEAKANGETWYYHDVNSEAYIARNTNSYESTELTIPKELDGYPVVGIVDGAFRGNHLNIKNIIIPNSVRHIEYGAFRNTTNLLSVVFPNTITNMGSSVFYNSPNLATIYLEEGSTFANEIFYDVYHGGTGLTPNCKIIRTKFENGLPVIPLENGVEEEPQLP